MTMAPGSHSSSSAPLRIEVDRRDPVAVVRLVGSCEMLEAERLTECLVGLASESMQLIVIDLSGLEFIESTGLGAIIAGHLRLRHHQGEIRLAAPPPAILRLLELTRLTQLFHVYPSVAAGLQGGC